MLAHDADLQPTPPPPPPQLVPPPPPSPSPSTPHQHVDQTNHPDSIEQASPLPGGPVPSDLKLPSFSLSPSFSPSPPPLWSADPVPDTMSFRTSSQHQAGNASRFVRSSATWTSSSADLSILSDPEDLEDRTSFVKEFNRLAKKHGVKSLLLEKLQPYRDTRESGRPSIRRSWLSRLLRRWSLDLAAQKRLRERSREAGNPTAWDQTLGSTGRKRSMSDLASRFMQHRRGSRRTLDIQTMIRLSGKSLFYLPAEYTPGSLALPTGIRATAQYLAHYAAQAHGVFRIPGSARIVNALYDYYYSSEEAEADIAGTVRCPNLPFHICVSVHDVASAFKKLLGALPGGILGSLPLFDALVSIHSGFLPEPEYQRTRQTKIRSRLTALAIASVPSKCRRELICAVFGLLCFMGRAAETAPREDNLGRPLPTSDLMGYTALGIIFGPLLVGDLLATYFPRHASSEAGFFVFPTHPSLPPSFSTPQLGTRPDQRCLAQGIDEVRIANDVVRMIITNWRDVVRHLRSLLAERRQSVCHSALANESVSAQTTGQTAATRGMPEGRWMRMRPLMDNLDAGVPDTSSSGYRTWPSTSKLDLEQVAEEHGRSTPRESLHSRRVSSTKRALFNQLSPMAEEAALEEPKLGFDDQHVSRLVTHPAGPSGSFNSKRSSSHDPQLSDQSEYNDSGSVMIASRPKSYNSPPQVLLDGPGDKRGSETLDSRNQDSALVSLHLDHFVPLSGYSSFASPLRRSTGGRDKEQGDEADRSPSSQSVELIMRDRRPDGSQSAVTATALSTEPCHLAESANITEENLSETKHRLPVNAGDADLDPRVAAWDGPPTQRSSAAERHIYSTNIAAGSLDLDPTSLNWSPDSPNRRTGPGLSPGSAARSVRSMAAIFEGVLFQGGSSSMFPQPSTPGFFSSQPGRTLVAKYISHASPGDRPAVSMPSTTSSPTARPDTASDLSFTPPSRVLAQGSTDGVSLHPSTRAPLPLYAPASANLGTMIPPHEPPPVAQYVKLPRPRSQASIDPPRSPPHVATAGGVGRSFSLLHSQIRFLHRQLGARTDEVAQLRRQLEARESAEVGTLSERLRTVEREYGMWRDRALAAERRVKSLEAVTSARDRWDKSYGSAARTESNGTAIGRTRHWPAEQDGASGFDGTHSMAIDDWRELSRGTVEMWIAAQGMMCDEKAAR